jgi:hypothetical protein
MDDMNEFEDCNEFINMISRVDRHATVLRTRKCITHSGLAQANDSGPAVRANARMDCGTEPS